MVLDDELLNCAHFDAGRCGSCTLAPVPYGHQIELASTEIRSLLAPFEAFWCEWEPVATGPRRGFRNKAKMVVTGSVEAPVLGIVDAQGAGVDLRDCRLYSASLEAAFKILAEFVAVARLDPYDVAARRGELKYLLVTESPDSELMVRFVLRSQEAVARIRKFLPWLTERLPALQVATVNVQPVHAAVLEGDLEIILSQDDRLPMRLGDVTLLLPPRSFFQTNSVVAQELYETARRWVDELAPRGVVDLFCGVGGFALFLARGERRVLGLETSAEAVEGAREAARLAALDVAGSAGGRVEFVAADAGDVAGYLEAAEVPDVMVVNPPRRGIGADLCTWLRKSEIRHVLYSSCNPVTLAGDLDHMRDFRITRARVLDMFPHTRHVEVLVMLERTNGVEQEDD